MFGTWDSPFTLSVLEGDGVLDSEGVLDMSIELRCTLSGSLSVSSEGVLDMSSEHRLDPATVDAVDAVDRRACCLQLRAEKLGS